MKFKISNIKIPLETDITIEQFLCENGINTSGKVTVAKQSVDFRKKTNPLLVYTVIGECKKNYGEKTLKSGIKITPFETLPENPIVCGDKLIETPPVVAGSGPAGIFCAYMLAKAGYRPVIIERGGDMDARKKDVEKFWQTGVLNTESNVQFGEGGAGTFSDGKLTTRTGDPRGKTVLETFVKFGASEDILYAAKPHIGTDVLSDVIKNMRKEIVRLGGSVRFNTRLESIGGNKKLEYVTLNGEKTPCNLLVLAIGHSARDTFEMLAEKGVAMAPKDFAAGFRTEHLQSAINRAQYGDFAGHPKLKNADYNFAARSGDRGVYTFCMCPGGHVVAAASEQNMVAVNGMSYHARSGENANSAVVVQVSSKDFGDGIFDGMNFQRDLEKLAFENGGKNYFAPVQTLEKLLGTKANTAVNPTYKPGVKHCDFEKIFPGFMVSAVKDGLAAFGRKLKGFDDGGAVLTAVETRTSSPVRILRGENGQSVSFVGVYPAGEGAGYAGGIMSAAVDGIKTAEKIISEYKPL